MAASSKQTAKAKSGTLSSKPKPRSSSAKSRQTTRRLDGGGEVGPLSQTLDMGGDERRPYFEALRAKWLTDETDLLLLEACEIPNQIQALPKKATNEEKRQQSQRRERAVDEVYAAVVWESLRFLYFTDQLSPFWKCWIDDDVVNALRRFQSKKTTDSFGPTDSRFFRFFIRGKFPELAFVELPSAERKGLVIKFGEQRAAKLIRASQYEFLTLANWAFEQIKSRKSDDIFTQVFGPMIQRPTGSPNRTQIILEIDWARGLEEIQRDFVKAIRQEWGKSHQEGRKARRETDDKFLKGLLLKRRRELRGFDWPHVCTLDGREHYPIYETKREDKQVGPSSARAAMRQTQSKLDGFLAEMAHDEERLRNTDQSAWIESYRQVSMWRACRK